MEKLIAHAPEVAKYLLDKCITISDHSKLSCKVYNFEFLDPPPGNQNRYYFGPECMARHQRENLLSHELTVKLVKEKWARLSRWIYIINLLFYLLFVSLLTSLLLTDTERPDM